MVSGARSREGSRLVQWTSAGSLKSLRLGARPARKRLGIYGGGYATTACITQLTCPQRADVPQIGYGMCCPRPASLPAPREPRSRM